MKALYLFLIFVTIAGCGEPPESPYHAWNLGTVEVGTPQVITDLLPADSEMGQTYIFTAGVPGPYVISFMSMSNPNARLSWYIDDYPVRNTNPAVFCYKSSTESGTCLTESLEAGKFYQVIVYEWNRQATGYTIKIEAPL